MIGVKDNTVNLVGLCNQITLALYTLDAIFAKYNSDTIITSANDGVHSNGSLHFIGHAVDIRIWYIKKYLEAIKKEFLKFYPNGQFDFVIEKDHIHLEFQPKKIL